MDRRHTGPVRLLCAVQCYDWGLTGDSSAVALLSAANSGADIDPARPYAEFWMGTHPSGPSYLHRSPTTTLKSYIAGEPSVLGDVALHRWGADLPFLFKVLSVGRALSIQAHPDKELAEVLHRTQPEFYRDANHKPEMAIALTEFSALCGFVGVEELKNVFRNVPEITDLVGNEEATKVLDIEENGQDNQRKEILQSVFTEVMSASKEMVSEVISRLKKRLVEESKVRILTEKEKLVLLLEKQYPNDIGVISVFFFNHLKLKIGEAIYIGANEPHAYLSGECIECMATSDNVVRAGFTPKFRDVKTLCSMLTYIQGQPDILKATSVNHYISRYISPFDEFEVDHIRIPLGDSVVLSAQSGPSIFIVVSGEGSMQSGADMRDDILQGYVYFAPANCELNVEASASELQLYRAGVNSRFLG